MESIYSYQAITFDETFIQVFTTNDWQEKHILVYLVDFVQYLCRRNFVHGAFEDFLSWTKIFKVKTNHPHLVRIGDDRKFV